MIGVYKGGDKVISSETFPNKLCLHLSFHGHNHEYEYRKYMNISNMNITNMKITICNVLGKANVFLLGQVQIEKNEKEELEWMAQNNDAPARVEIFTPFFTRIFSTHFCSILFFLSEQF